MHPRGWCRSPLGLLCALAAGCGAGLSFVGPGRPTSHSPWSRVHASTEEPVSASPVEGEDSADFGSFSDEAPYDSYDSLAEPSEDVLQAWAEDELITEILRNLQSNASKGRGEGVLAFRDVYRLLEMVNVERHQFVAMFTDEFESDLDDYEFFEDEEEEDGTTLDYPDMEEAYMDEAGNIVVERPGEARDDTMLDYPDMEEAYVDEAGNSVVERPR